MATLKEKPAPKQMLDARAAASAARAYLKQLIFEADNITLEEVELDEDERYWLITLGYQDGKPSDIEKMLGRRTPKYKVFKVDTLSGRVVSMKIRHVE